VIDAAAARQMIGSGAAPGNSALLAAHLTARGAARGRPRGQDG
jgi:hypothetical protein